LRGSNLSFANANGAVFTNGDLSKITARNMQAQKSMLARAELSDSDYSYSDLRGANCNESTMNNALLYRTDIRDSRFYSKTS
jgi:uncharacterized protein YjbI with pentapeptide repeats